MLQQCAKRAPWALAGFLYIAVPGQLMAAVAPERTDVFAEKEFRHPDLSVEDDFRAPDELPLAAASEARRSLTDLGVSLESARLDTRGGRFVTLLPSEPTIPGTGYGNHLSWENLNVEAPRSLSELEDTTLELFTSYLQNRRNELGIDPEELADGNLVIHGSGEVVQIHLPRKIDGIPVHDSYVSAVINHGNLVLMGAHRWGDVVVPTKPRLDIEGALVEAHKYLEPLEISDFWGKNDLLIVALARQQLGHVEIGRGYTHRLAWVVRPSFEGEMGRWELLIDAHSGEILSFQDTTHYADRTVKGGVYPVSNDGTPPDGVEQAGWPMPFDIVSHPGGTATTDAGGNLPSNVTGNVTSTLSGQFVHINDSCGAVSLTGAGDVDFGTSGGTDCVTPGFGGAGNTHSSRTGFYELNRMREMARGQLPGNSWLQQRLTANMNLGDNCNASWNGTVNFRRSGGGCANTGEIAGILDHEWGHGLDDNDAVPNIARPSGEGIADVYAALRINDSCIGRNYKSTDCSGYGDPCWDCTGIRDIDYIKRNSRQPHDYTWSNANCQGGAHCVGAVYSEAVWSLWKRELQRTPYNYDDNTAHEIVNRLTFIGAGNTGTWFSGGPPDGGCGGSSGYMNYLAADDDDGNLNNGTPHMTAIFEAFNDQEIACDKPAVQDSGCSGTPTQAPNVTATPGDRSAQLSWSAVSGASSYEVFRTDGVNGCSFGKTRLGETTSRSWSDSGLQNGRNYYYIVIPKGSADACFGPASTCKTVVPEAGGPGSCQPPASGDWVITTDCSIVGTVTVPANVIVDNNSTLTVEPSGVLDINFLQRHLLVRDGSRTIIRAGGKID